MYLTLTFIILSIDFRSCFHEMKIILLGALLIASFSAVWTASISSRGKTYFSLCFIVKVEDIEVMGSNPCLMRLFLLKNVYRLF